MEDPAPLPPNTDSDPQLQIAQNVKGDRNQTIGQVLGGMVVYGTVIYNNPPASADATANQDLKIGVNPYKGLLAFQETDGDRFFGRDLQIKELWDKFRSLHEDEAQTRLLTIYGPSGSGKSSLARAGLIPELARRPLPGRERARVAVLVPSSHPLESLATVLARIVTNDSSPVAKIREFATELAQANAEGIYDGLRRIANALPEIEISPLIVLVDQLEEVFTLCKDSAERNAFIGNLLCAAADRSKRVSAIVTLRSDFLGATQKHPQLNQLIGLQGFFVAAMGEEGLREAIAKPAEMAGHPLDLSTVDLLIEQTAGREGALPLLQFALTRIWAGLEEGKEPAETLKEIGGVGGALAGEAQRIYGSLTPVEQEIARRVFLGLVQLGEGAKDTRRRTDLERVVSHRDSLEQVQKVIARFADPGARLITLADNRGEETAEVTHEALFDNWQQLKDWLDSSRSDLRFQRRLDDAVIIWQENERAEGNLWRSPDLDLLRRYQKRAGDDMTPLQVEFLNASVDSTEKAAKEKRRQRQVLVGVMSTGLMLTSGAAIFSLFQVQQTQRQQVEQLAANAQALLASNHTVNAVIYAIAATGLSQSTLVQFPDRPQFASVDGSLLDVVRGNREQNQFLNEESVTSVAFSPDGQRILSGSLDKKTVRIWDAKTGMPIGQPLTGHEEGVISVSYSPDGQRILSGSLDKTLRIWDAKTGMPIGQPLTGHEEGVISVSYSPDGQRILSGSLDKTLRIWDAKTGAPIRQILPSNGLTIFSVSYSPDSMRIISIAGGDEESSMVRIWDAKTGAPIGKPLIGDEVALSYSPDGQRIVTGSRDKTVRIWNVQAGAPIGKPLTGHEGVVNSVSYSPDGQRIVSGSRDKTVRIWDAQTGMPIGQPLTGHEGVVSSVAFSPDGKYIVSSSDDKTVRIWDAQTGTPIRKPLLGHEGVVSSVAFSPDGKYIISGSDDKTVQIWDAQTGTPIGKPLLGHDGKGTLLAVSQDGQRIVSGSDDKTVQIWDAQTGAPIGQPLTGHEGVVSSVAFSPDGKYIVSGSDDKTVRIWDAQTGASIGKPLLGHEGAYISVAISPDGKYIVSGSDDKTVRIWDVQTGAPIGKPLGHENRVSSVAISPDGKYIVSGSDDKTVRIWDAKTGAPIGKPLLGHEGLYISVAYSPDSQRIVSSSSDNTVRIWHAQTGAPIGKPLKEGNDGGVSLVSYSPDGQHIVSGGYKTVLIWDVTWKSLLPIACNQLRYHPSLNQPTTDVAREAKQTCEQYVWKK
jgi:WD40 repeat protein